MNFVSGNDQTQQPAPAFSLVFPGSRPNNRDHRTGVSMISLDWVVTPKYDFVNSRPSFSGKSLLLYLRILDIVLLIHLALLD
jgi:hypothetical protein